MFSCPESNRGFSRFAAMARVRYACVRQPVFVSWSPVDTSAGPKIGRLPRDGFSIIPAFSCERIWEEGDGEGCRCFRRGREDVRNGEILLSASGVMPGIFVLKGWPSPRTYTRSIIPFARTFTHFICMHFRGPQHDEHHIPCG